MKIAVGCDHGGFPLKRVVIDSVKAPGYVVICVGTVRAGAGGFSDFPKKIWGKNKRK